jgi:diguanylate cyclase (GGDEF)-like protein
MQAATLVDPATAQPQLAPVAPAADPGSTFGALGEPTRHPPVGRSGSARILSMEDDPAQAAFIRAVLTGAGHAVRSCSDPRRFAAEVADFQPDLVLLDVLLPGSSGFELARSIRDNPGTCRPPVLFVTAESEMSSRVQAAMVGGDGYLVKPLQSAYLLSTVTDRLEREARVQLLLEYDAQTYLLTRRAFLERAKGAVERKGKDPRRRSCWAVIALDGMPSINSLHGPDAGDQVLSCTAALLRRSLVPGESAGRYQGAAYALLLDDVRPKQALARLEELRQLVAQSDFRSDAGRFRVTLSGGVAELLAGMTVEAWAETADRGLEAAKAAGGNRIDLAR